MWLILGSNRILSRVGRESMGLSEGYIGFYIGWVNEGIASFPELCERQHSLSEVACSWRVSPWGSFWVRECHGYLVHRDF